MPLTSVDDYDTLLSGIKTGYSVVDFWATWCKPCKDIAPDFEKMSNENDFSDVKFFKCNIADFEEDDLVDMGLQKIPAFFIYKDGVKVEEFVGNECLGDLKAKLVELCG